MADTYYYKVSFSILDSITGIKYYPAGSSFTLSASEEAMYHIEIYKNNTRVQALTSTTLGDNTAAMTKVAGALVSGVPLPPYKTSNIQGTTTWNAVQQGNSAANWLSYVQLSTLGPALVKPLNPPPANLVQYQDSSGVWHNIPQAPGNVTPTVSFSISASVAPKTPTGTALTSDLKLQNPSNVFNTLTGQTAVFTYPQNTTFVSKCAGATTAYWISPLIIPVITPATTILGQRQWDGKTYSYEIRFYNKDGSAGDHTVKFTNLKDFTIHTLFYSTGANCPVNTVAATNPNPNPNPSSNSTRNGTIGNGSITFNPPNNIKTRSDPYGIKSAGKTSSPNAIAKLGYIYQDNSTAQAINTDASGGFNTLWGFKFTYNPTTFNYGTQSSSNLDVTTFAKDPANLIGGNTVINLELYLNRIADFQDLTTGTKAADVQELYPVLDSKFTGVDDNAVSGILSRGTEYDLEFLYRVVNGNPRQNNVLGDSTSATDMSADFGYITGVPFKLHLNDNLVYFCSIQTLNVTHVMFTPSMVPMLSVVSLSLMRYPGVNGAEAATVSNLISASNTVNQSLTTPPKKKA